MSQRSPLLAIWLSIIVVLVLMVMPIPSYLPVWVARVRPELLVLVCVFWNVRFPEKFSVGSAWMAGLLLDVLIGSIMGQRALCLALVVALSHRFHRQFRAYTPTQRLVGVGLLVLVYTLMLVWIDGMAGHPLTHTVYRWIPVLTSLLCWPIISGLLNFVQRRFSVQG